MVDVVEGVKVSCETSRLGLIDVDVEEATATADDDEAEAAIEDDSANDRRV